LTGWCSWYFVYERISADLLRENFDNLAKWRRHVPTNVAVVDDGYMTAWGDWDSVKPQQFPAGMKVVADHIQTSGMRPGIWLAPFAADKHSVVTKEHPDWIVRNHLGIPANSSNCGKFFYGLDATHPSVRAHVHESIRRAVHDWGFNVLKIDFLYAACLDGNGKYDLSMSRAEAMDVALQTIRHAAGPTVFLIGCGCPIATGIGFVDAMRVSADTGPTWYPPMPLPWWDQGTLPALRSMVRNSIARAPMGHRWWHNDPDCLMFGEHTRLTNEEIASAASIVAMTCGMLLLSDDLPKVPASRMHILTKIFPMTGASAVVLDLHSTNFNGLPSLMRLWCTDKYEVWDQVQETFSFDSEDHNLMAAIGGHGKEESERDHNARATYMARLASFRLNERLSEPEERERSCIHVTKGLGTWTVVSISNWLDTAQVVHVPPPAMLPPPRHGWNPLGSVASSDDGDDDICSNVSGDDDSPVKNKRKEKEYGKHGYHVFAFWSSRYSWIPRVEREDEPLPHGGHHHAISTKLGPHATEIFHIKPVIPDEPQYIGSDMHFSCGQELILFRPDYNTLDLWLNTTYHRSGNIFVFVPRVSPSNIRVTVHGKTGRWTTVGNTPSINENGSPRLAGRVITIPVTVQADGSEDDGYVKIDF